VEGTSKGHLGHLVAQRHSQLCRRHLDRCFAS